MNIENSLLIKIGFFSINNGEFGKDVEDCVGRLLFENDYILI
jgi:hypothetical protein